MNRTHRPPTPALALLVLLVTCGLARAAPSVEAAAIEGPKSIGAGETVSVVPVVIQSGSSSFTMSIFLVTEGFPYWGTTEVHSSTVDTTLGTWADVIEVDVPALAPGDYRWMLSVSAGGPFWDSAKSAKLVEVRPPDVSLGEPPVLTPYGGKLTAYAGAAATDTLDQTFAASLLLSDDPHPGDDLLLAEVALGTTTDAYGPWETDGIAPGEYWLIVKLAPLPGEVDLADNVVVAAAPTIVAPGEEFLPGQKLVGALAPGEARVLRFPSSGDMTLTVKAKKLAGGPLTVTVERPDGSPVPGLEATLAGKGAVATFPLPKVENAFNLRVAAGSGATFKLATVAIGPAEGFKAKVTGWSYFHVPLLPLAKVKLSATSKDPTQPLSLTIHEPNGTFFASGPAVSHEFVVAAAGVHTVVVQNPAGVTVKLKVKVKAYDAKGKVTVGS